MEKNIEYVLGILSLSTQLLKLAMGLFPIPYLAFITRISIKSKGKVHVLTRRVHKSLLPGMVVSHISSAAHGRRPYPTAFCLSRYYGHQHPVKCSHPAQNAGQELRYGRQASLWPQAVDAGFQPANHYTAEPLLYPF